MQSTRNSGADRDCSGGNIFERILKQSIGEMQNLAGIDMIHDLHCRYMMRVGEIERYNVFHTSLIVRHSEDKKLYLYDILDIKKETSNPIEP